MRKREVAHKEQVCPLEQDLQVESQVKHFPLERYFPTTHPGAQVVLFKSHPSLHSPHLSMVASAHFEQATLQSLQVSVSLSP